MSQEGRDIQLQYLVAGLMLKIRLAAKDHDEDTANYLNNQLHDEISIYISDTANDYGDNDVQRI